jgi:protein JSN1
MSTARPTEHLTIGFPPLAAPAQNRATSPTASSPPVDPSAVRPPFGLTSGLSPSKMANVSRSGAGSPSHDMVGAGRLFSKR